MVLLSGGIKELKGKLFFSRKVLALDLFNNEWLAEKTVPSLNESRYLHSSCTVGNTVAVIAGVN